MRIINSRDIMETIEMLTAENLDVRTVTMGISLLDCIDPDPDKACEKIYNKITRLAGNLVPVVNGISEEYGIPIVNKRISVTPIAMLLGAAPDADPVQYAKTLDRAAKAVGVNFIGGFGALVHKGFSAGDKRLIAAIPRALAETDIVCSSVNIGSTKSGINMDAVKLMGEVVRETAELTKDNMCMGDAKLVVFCNAPEDNPFMAGAFHGAGEPDCEIHVGVSGPGAVRAALAKLPKDAPMDEVAELVKRTAFKITRLGQLVANLASERLGVPAGIIDLSLAPTPAIGDSVANILEEMGLESCGCCGTTACLALLNDAVKKGGVMASNHVGGLSGAFIPVSEDDGMINAANCGSLTLEKLEAMTAVCSVGIDMVVIPGDTSAEVISGLIADEAAIGMVNSKTTAVRVIPAIGHKAGDVLDFGGLLGHAPIMPISQYSPAVMIHRGGRIPAPMQALKNYLQYKHRPCRDWHGRCFFVYSEGASSLQNVVHGCSVGSGLDRSGEVSGCRRVPRDAYASPTNRPFTAYCRGGIYAARQHCGRRPFKIHRPFQPQSSMPSRSTSPPVVPSSSSRSSCALKAALSNCNVSR